MKNPVKNLLSINRKAFRFLHDAVGFDFEQPYFITEQPGKFTVNTVKKAVQAGAAPGNYKIVVFVVPTDASYKEGLFFATLDREKFNGSRIDGVSYWDYNAGNRAGDIDYCLGVGNFEDLRKNQTEKVYIIAQNKKYIEQPKKKVLNLSARYALISTGMCGDGRGNTYIGKMTLQATDGSAARFEYKPYDTFYGYEKKSADIGNFIDNSGYLLRPHRFDLMQKAENLRRTRNKAEADQADFTKETAELQDLIEEARRTLSAAILSCNNPEYAEAIVNKTRAFSYSLSRFATFKEDLTTKKYTSIDCIKAAIDGIMEKLNYCTEGSK